MYGRGNTGIHGFSFENVGVHGTGIIGVWGEARDNGSAGVSGTYQNTVGRGVGVYGNSNGDEGIGVEGFGRTGVRGQGSFFNEGSGVLGEGFKAIEGKAFDGGFSGHFSNGKLFATNDKPNTTTMEVTNNDITGNSTAIYGESLAPTGTGIFGVAGNPGTGITYAVRGHVNAANGFSGHFTGGKFYIAERLGINTTAPTQRLDIDGQIRIRGGSPGAGKVLTSDANGTASWQTPAGGGSSFTLPFAGNSTTGTNSTGFGPGVFNITHSGTTGSVGAVYGLSNSPNGIGVGGIIGASTAGGTGILGQANHPTAVTYGVQGKVSSANGFSGHFTGGKFYIDGNVGIGTQFPRNKLHVNGGILLGTGDATNTYENGGGFSYFPGSGNFNIYSGGNASNAGDMRFIFRVNNMDVDHFRIRRNGNIGIGFPNANTNLINQKLAINGSARMTSNLFWGDGDNLPFVSHLNIGTGRILFMSSGGSGVNIKNVVLQAGTGEGSGLRPVNNNNVNLSSSATRWLTIWSNNTINTSSDRNLKQDITNIEQGLDKVMRMRPVSYRWIEDDGLTHLGFIAQEMEQILPEVVRKPQKISSEIAATNGEKGVTAYAMAYAEMIPVLTKAIQEQQLVIEKLQAQITALQTEKTTAQLENTDLQNRIQHLEAGLQHIELLLPQYNP